MMNRISIALTTARCLHRDLRFIEVKIIVNAITAPSKRDSLLTTRHCSKIILK
jgi:hypothetical protein